MFEHSRPSAVRQLGLPMLSQSANFGKLKLNSVNLANNPRNITPSVPIPGKRVCRLWSHEQCRKKMWYINRGIQEGRKDGRIYSLCLLPKVSLHITRLGKSAARLCECRDITISRTSPNSDIWKPAHIPRRRPSTCVYAAFQRGFGRKRRWKENTGKSPCSGAPHHWGQCEIQALRWWENISLDKEYKAQPLLRLVRFCLSFLRSSFHNFSSCLAAQPL